MLILDHLLYVFFLFYAAVFSSKELNKNILREISSYILHFSVDFNAILYDDRLLRSKLRLSSLGVHNRSYASLSRLI